MKGLTMLSSEKVGSGRGVRSSRGSWWSVEDESTALRVLVPRWLPAPPGERGKIKKPNVVVERGAAQRLVQVADRPSRLSSSISTLITRHRPTALLS